MRTIAVGLLALALAACGDGGGESGDGGAGGAGGEGGMGGAGGMGGGAGGQGGDGGSGGAPVRPAGDCDPLVPEACAMPWPSNLYLVEDASRETGYRLSFGAETLPVNNAGKRIDPAPYERLDGYGPDSPLLAIFPNLDVTGLPDENHVAGSMADDAPILWFEVDGERVRRVPYWVELDSFEPDPAKKTLFVRPAVILGESKRYVVAFRNLRDTAGAPIAPGEAFAKLRDGETGGDPALGPRQARFDAVFSLLEAQGVPRDTLTLAWDFHTASCAAMHGPMLHMRDEALATVGAEGSELSEIAVTEFVREDDGSGAPVSDQWALRVDGRFRVPDYTTPLEVEGVVGFVLNRGADGKPAQDGWRSPRFIAMVPWSALDGSPHGLIQFGHGLLGEADQVESGYLGEVANAGRYVFVATDWSGMSSEDEARTNFIVTDFRAFVWLAERMHQGMLEFLLLTRAIRERFPTLDVFTERAIALDPARLYYNGISQGGIYGATFMALTQDVTRGQLGVPGQNYSTLLHRSVDFDPFFAAMEATYPGRAQQAIILSTVQQLWNGTDPVSYYRHVKAEPFPETPSHEVLLATAKGDYQVATVTTEVVARSGLGVEMLAPYHPERPAVDLVETVPYPHRGSGLVVYDFGNPWPAPGNHPPMDDLGDPHGKPRRAAHHQAQMIRFLETGEIVDVCGGDGCTPD